MQGRQLSVNHQQNESHLDCEKKVIKLTSKLLVPWNSKTNFLLKKKISYMRSQYPHFNNYIYKCSQLPSAHAYCVYVKSNLYKFDF